MKLRGYQSIVATEKAFVGIQHHFEISRICRRQRIVAKRLFRMEIKGKHKIGAPEGQNFIILVDPHQIRSLGIEEAG